MRKRMLAIATMSLAVPLIALASASPAMAQPKGIFEVFKECPTEYAKYTESGEILCSVDKTTSGEVAIGSTKVPINKEIVQQGGFANFPESEVEYFGLPAKNGESLSKTALNVPGGLLDLIDCEDIGTGFIEIFFREACKATFEKGITEVTATTELVANEKNPVIFNEAHLAKGKGTAITMPIRVHLKNSFLGNECYIGSESEPIELHLTTGETSPPAGVTPLKGKVGTLESVAEKGYEKLRITGNSLVDNDWASPGSNGCGELYIWPFGTIHGFLDSLVNDKLGIPNAAGKNAAVLDGELQSSASPNVIASESF